MPTVSLIPRAGSSASTSTDSFGVSSRPPFPHTGRLGLSPVVFEGVAVTRLSGPERSFKAVSIDVVLRCVEHRRSGAFGSSGFQETLWQTSRRLWSRPDQVEWATLGDWETDFRLEIPVEAAKDVRSTCFLKEMRVVWKLEVTLHHKTAGGSPTYTTKSLEIPLTIYSEPVLSAFSPFGGDETVSLTAGALDPPCRLYVSPEPRGPGETINVLLRGVDPDAGRTGASRRLTASLRRRIEFFSEPATPPSEASSEMPTPPSTEPESAFASSSTDFGTNAFLLSSTPSSVFSLVHPSPHPTVSHLSLASFASNDTSAPLLSPPSSAPEARSSSVRTRARATSSRLGAFFSGSGSSTRSSSAGPPRKMARQGSDQWMGSSRRAAHTPPPPPSDALTVKLVDGNTDVIRWISLTEWEMEIALQIPANRGSSRWQLGETGRSSRIVTEFEVQVEIVPGRIPVPSSSEASEADCQPVTVNRSFPIYLTSTSAAERRAARARIARARPPPPVIIPSSKAAEWSASALHTTSSGLLSVDRPISPSSRVRHRRPHASSSAFTLSPPARHPSSSRRGLLSPEPEDFHSPRYYSSSYNDPASSNSTIRLPLLGSTSTIFAPPAPLELPHYTDLPPPLRLFPNDPLSPSSMSSSSPSALERGSSSTHLPPLSASDPLDLPSPPSSNSSPLSHPLASPPTLPPPSSFAGLYRPSVDAPSQRPYFKNPFLPPPSSFSSSSSASTSATASDAALHNRQGRPPSIRIRSSSPVAAIDRAWDEADDALVGLCSGGRRISITQLDESLHGTAAAGPSGAGSGSSSRSGAGRASGSGSEVSGISSDGNGSGNGGSRRGRGGLSVPQALSTKRPRTAPGFFGGLVRAFGS